MSRSLTLQGYDALAELFGRHPSLGVFRLFKELNAANLLDLQAEVLNLRRDLQVFTHGKDDSSACTECDYQTPSVYHMKESDCQSCPYHERIWRKKLEIREKLKEYNEAQLHFERLISHRRPTKRNLQALRIWLKTKGSGANFLQGTECYTWSEDAEDDFGTFDGDNRDNDGFSRLLEGPLLQWWADMLGDRRQDPLSVTESSFPSDLLGPIRHHPDSHIARVAHTANTIFASLLPTVPVFVLNYIDSQVARMGAILVMTLIFSTLLTMLTNAKRSDVFAAATAFTAVQAVFLSNSNGI